MFYSNHLNRKNAFFRKHILNRKEPVNVVRDAIFTQMFGPFNRIRKSVKD